MAFETPREVVASAARTTTASSAAINLNKIASRINLMADVTAVSGTAPTLDLTVEWSPDAGTTWAKADAADAFTQITATGAKVKQFNIKAPTYRITWTIAGGTPSFTFSINEYLT